MRKIIKLAILLLLPVGLMAQSTDDIVTRCVLAAGDNTTYLKDYLIQLPKATTKADIPVHKANMYLMKNQKYRFTLCNTTDSKGELVFSLYENNNMVLSSFNSKSGKSYNTVDFTCNKTGLYQLWFNFQEGLPGKGVGVVLMVK